MPPSFRNGFLFALLFGIFASGSSAQTLPPKISTYTADDFDGHHQVFCAESFSNGRMAFGAGSTVLLFQGEEFKKVPTGSGNAVFSMDADSNDCLYVGGQSLMGVIIPDATGEPSFHSLIPLLPDSLRDINII